MRMEDKYLVGKIDKKYKIVAVDDKYKVGKGVRGSKYNILRF